MVDHTPGGTMFLPGYGTCIRDLRAPGYHVMLGFEELRHRAKSFTRAYVIEYAQCHPSEGMHVNDDDECFLVRGGRASHRRGRGSVPYA